MFARAIIVIASLLANATSFGQAPPPEWPDRATMDLSVQTQRLYLNVSGDCVQDSLGMKGAHLGDMSLATLIWDTEYGPAERGGSGPDRVARYCRQRGIEVWNVTGRSFKDTKPWIDYSIETGRFAAVGCFNRHVQTMWGKDAEGHYLVQNNWQGTFGKPYIYTEDQFARKHEESGAWVVISVAPPPAVPPVYVKWWK